MTYMHPYLVWNIGPPLWYSIVIRCLCSLSKTFSIFLIYRLIWVYRMLVLHSNVSSSSWVIHNDYWSCCLSSLTMHLANNHQKVYQSRSHLKFSISHKVASNWNILFKYMLSSTLMELLSRPGTHLIACNKRLIVVYSVFFSTSSSQFV
jgi:hypothetical protein